MKYHSSGLALLTYESKDTNWWVVWLGRHPAENVSAGPKG